MLVLELLWTIAQASLSVLRPVLGPLLMVLAWWLAFATVLTVWRTARQGVQQAQQMHRIPCVNCQFFTGDYRLKCTVRPEAALTEDAIDCRDFQPGT